MTDQVQLQLITRYRRFLYFLHRLPRKGVLSNGIPVSVEDPSLDVTHGDVVHPCVRYIAEGFEGHKWWMVYTPYYSGNDSLENPRLCYADSENDSPPTEWKYYCTIKETPEFGYNSDPTMLYKDGKLYVFWRECGTPATKKLGCNFATFGCKVSNGIVTYLQEAQLIDTVGDEYGTSDSEVSPTLMMVKNKLVSYAIHLVFTPQFIYKIPSKIGSFIYRHNIFLILDALGIYKHIKSKGVAIWVGSSIGRNLQYDKTVQFNGTSRLYQPWHMDVFSDTTDKDGRLYAVVQTSVKFADICLARSDDGENFVFYKKPLLTCTTPGLESLYKPTAIVSGKQFYMYYTVRDRHDLHLNRLYVTSTNWQELKRELDNE